MEVLCREALQITVSYELCGARIVHKGIETAKARLHPRDQGPAGAIVGHIRLLQEHLGPGSATALRHRFRRFGAAGIVHHHIPPGLCQLFHAGGPHAARRTRYQCHRLLCHFPAPLSKANFELCLPGTFARRGEPDKGASAVTPPAP